MYTIKQAALRCGVPETSLRAWERRYGVVSPRRTDSGYRLYDDEAIARLGRMRELVEQGWSPSAAAEALSGSLPTQVTAASARDGGGEGQVLTAELVRASAAVDVASIEAVLDRAFAAGSFESVVDSWLMPSLHEIGAAWADGRIDVAGEHTTSHAVMRRLSQAFASAGATSVGPRVVVGLPTGSHHELGALAFATALRRRGHNVVYVGADLPAPSWVRAVRAFSARTAVIAVPTEADRASAAETARLLAETDPTLVVAAGGAHAEGLAPGVTTLPHTSIADAVGALASA